jgi:hypothetical protein
MDKDDLSEADVRSAFLRGHVKMQLTEDARGTRFVVSGTPLGSDAEVDVICRFLPSGLLRIITVYQRER